MKQRRFNVFAATGRLENPPLQVSAEEAPLLPPGAEKPKEKKQENETGFKPKPGEEESLLPNTKSL